MISFKPAKYRALKVFNLLKCSKTPFRVIGFKITIFSIFLQYWLSNEGDDKVLTSLRDQQKTEHTALACQAARRISFGEFS